MKSNLTPDKERLSHDEYDALVSLKGVQAVLQSDDKVWSKLQERLRHIKYGCRDKGLVLSTLNRLLESIYATVPDSQIDTLYRNLSVTGLYVGVKVTNDSHLRDYSLILSYNQINALTSAAKEKCLVCNLNPQEQRSCPLAKIFDSLPGEKHEHSKGCGYFGL